MSAPLPREAIPALKRAIATLEESPDTLEPRESSARRLRDWMEDPELLRVPQVVIPQIVHEGRVTLLSGREKGGKSTLCGNLAAAASRGAPVLGVPLLDPICSAWYALDEPPGDAVRRFSNLSADPDGIIINAKPRTLDDLLREIELDATRYEEIAVAWIDNVTRVMLASGVNPSDNAEAGPFMIRLSDFLHDLNLAAVLLFHTNKGGREYLGGTQIAAPVDEVLTLRKRLTGDEDDFLDDDTDDGRRILVQDGRNLRGRLHLAFKEGVYSLYEETAEPRERILATLRDHGAVIGRSELVKLAGLRKKAGLDAVRDLIGSGQILEKGRQLSAVPTVPTSSLERGTKTEPMREPSKGSGSQTVSPRVTEPGTDDRGEAWEPDETLSDTRPSRVNNGVKEVLRLTQHGSRWFPEDA